jgi:hypothetical protein
MSRSTSSATLFLVRSFAPLVLASLLGCDPAPAPPATAPTPSTSPPPLAPTPGVLEHLELDELTPAHRGRTIRVHGWVAPGSIAQRHTPPTVRFTLVRADASLTVEHSGPLPERFGERLEAIVTGTLADDGAVLRSDELVARCPDDYANLPAWPERGGPR